MSVNSSQEEGGKPGVWLRVRILNSLVFSLRTTVRAVRDSLREADQSLPQGAGLLAQFLPAARRAQKYPRRISIVSACPQQLRCRRCRGQAHAGADHSGRSGVRVSTTPFRMVGTEGINENLLLDRFQIDRSDTGDTAKAFKRRFPVTSRAEI